MTKKLTCASYIAFVFIVMAMAAHITGFLTNFWAEGEGNDESNVMAVNTGLWRQTLTYQNGTEVEADSPLNIKEEQYLVMAIAGVNLLLCLTVVFKAIHVCVGVLAFIIMSLLFLCVYFTFKDTKEVVDRLQSMRPDWPDLSFSWSFYLVFIGLIVNIVATATFLTLVLLKGEIKASKSSKGLGPDDVTTTHNDRTALVSTVSGDNYAYDNLSHIPDASAQYASPSYAFPDSDLSIQVPSERYSHANRKLEESLEPPRAFIDADLDLDKDSGPSDIIMPDLSEQPASFDDIRTISESIRL